MKRPPAGRSLHNAPIGTRGSGGGRDCSNPWTRGLCSHPFTLLWGELGTTCPLDLLAASVCTSTYFFVVANGVSSKRLQIRNFPQHVSTLLVSIQLLHFQVRSCWLVTAQRKAHCCHPCAANLKQVPNQIVETCPRTRLPVTSEMPIGTVGRRGVGRGGWPKDWS